GLRPDQISIDGAQLHQPVVPDEPADVDTGIGSGQPVRIDTRVFDRLPRDFQQEVLLGIHTLRFAPGNTKKRSIELTDIVRSTRESTTDANDGDGLIRWSR